MKIEQLEESLPIEAIGGILRIGQEYSAFQEILIDWFFACSLLGTLLFAVFYYSLLKLTGWIWKAAMARHLRHVDLEEPPCDLQWDDDDGFEDIYAPFVDCQEDGFPERAGAEHDVPGNLSEEENQIHARVASNEDSYRHFESSENHEDIDRNEEEEDDEWEDLSRNAVDSPTNAYPASPMVGRCMGTVDERTSDSREMTDGELSDFMLRGAFDNRVSTRQSFHTIHSRVKNLSANIDEGEPRQVHPFFFFFSW